MGRPSATPVGGLQAGHAEIIDFVADGVMGWAGHRAGDAFQPVDPYLIELGWRAWYCMVEENVLGQMGFPDHLVTPGKVRWAGDAGHATVAYISNGGSLVAE